jgi:hypothetical protein
MWKRALVLAGLMASFAIVMIGIGFGQVMFAREKLRTISGNESLQISEVWNTGACGTFQLSPSDVNRPYNLQDQPFLAGVTPDTRYLKEHPAALDAEIHRWSSCMDTHARTSWVGHLAFPVSVALAKMI